MSVATFTATLRLGLVVSAVAVLAAVVLTFVGEVAQWPMATAVAGAGFALSWVQTGRLDRGGEPLLAWSAPSRHAGRHLG